MRKRKSKQKLVQTLFAFPPGRGGKRRGAGRKPRGQRAGRSHAKRADFEARCPVHVTHRIRGGLPALRRGQAHGALLAVFAGSNAKGLVRVVHFSIQSNQCARQVW